MDCGDGRCADDGRWAPEDPSDPADPSWRTYETLIWLYTVVLREAYCEAVSIRYGSLVCRVTYAELMLVREVPEQATVQV